jgi:hypothetical protein
VSWLVYGAVFAAVYAVAWLADRAYSELVEWLDW